ncbi:unnamed protein product [Linum tenue]|uniref:Uncharacterized protein n=1 Tax=Linum tenue TaxID=586396 RepID=A0AAV0HKP7_9ROSI|nr:unnamed protein product [Linum tenue]CAI0386213.1 unnamed protein product [Linum tenue]
MSPRDSSAAPARRLGSPGPPS